MPLAREPVVVYEQATAVFRGYVPRAPLDRWIEIVWFAAGAPTVDQERVLPNGVVELIINLGPAHRVVDETTGRFTRYQRAWVAGMQTGPLTIASESSTHLVGIRFRMGGAYPFLATPLAEITNHVIESDSSFGVSIHALRERLLDTPRELDQLDLVETTLLSRVRVAAPTDTRVQRAARLVATAPHGHTVGQIARSLGISHKHLIHLFNREVGIGPKMLGRIMRFQHVLHAIDTTPAHAASWTAIAHASGYADQAHLTNDFRALTGTTPTAYRRTRTADPNHIAVAPAR